MPAAKVIGRVGDVNRLPAERYLVGDSGGFWPFAQGPRWGPGPGVEPAIWTGTA